MAIIGDELKAYGYVPLDLRTSDSDLKNATAEVLRAVEKLKRAGGVEGLVIMDAELNVGSHIDPNLGLHTDRGEYIFFYKPKKVSS